MISKIY